MIVPPLRKRTVPPVCSSSSLASTFISLALFPLQRNLTTVLVFHRFRMCCTRSSQMPRRPTLMTFFIA